MAEVFHPDLSLSDCRVDIYKDVIDYAVWGAHMKILIIEADGNTVDFIKNVFDVGWPEAEFVFAHSGKNGIGLVENEKPDVVLLDLGLPDMSGFEVLKQIRHNTEMTIVLMTVRDDESDIVHGLTLGADEYIIKPFRQLELLARIRALTRRKLSV